ncbi:MAG: TetR/AcrR family transcriptional regulator [Lachnospiraceae bacterium]|nr:TetR/AcrR family transcriptional regulator [Lachnospiraceae bacterium]
MAKSTKRDKPVNEPKQKRSIETRNKILEVGSTLMLSKGYHNVTTDDIAKAAGLSTGIVYHYFKDKKDILLIALDQRADALYEGFTEKFAATTEGNFEAFLNTLFDFLLEYHKQAWVIHEELEGLYHSDPEIAATTNKFWEKAYVSIAEIYAKKSGKPEHALEKTRMALDVIEDYCHACMNPIIESLDQDFMRQEAIIIIKSLLT